MSSLPEEITRRRTFAIISHPDGLVVQFKLLAKCVDVKQRVMQHLTGWN
jgi:peptide subunit release factor RF-3